jgi:hypothetical protein
MGMGSSSTPVPGEAACTSSQQRAAMRCHHKAACAPYLVLCVRCGARPALTALHAHTHSR